MDAGDSLDAGGSMSWMPVGCRGMPWDAVLVLDAGGSMSRMPVGCRRLLVLDADDILSHMPAALWGCRPEVNTVPRQGHSSARERGGGGCLHLSYLAIAEPKTKRKWPAVPRATRTKRKIPAAGRSRYALPSRRIQHREGRIIRETKDRREQREANKCRKEERRIRRQCPPFDS